MMQLRSYDVTIARDGLDLEKAIEAGPGSGYDTHRVTVLHPDQLVAERLATTYKIPQAVQVLPDGTVKLNHPQEYNTLQCWAALRRCGIEVPAFDLFMDRVISLDLVKGESRLDPTTPTPDTG